MKESYVLVVYQMRSFATKNTKGENKESSKAGARSNRHERTSGVIYAWMKTVDATGKHAKLEGRS